MESNLATGDERLGQLNRYFEAVDSVILTRQHPVTGLLPASTAKTVHGDYTDAWVRDNVYSIYAVWGLTVAYRRHAPDDRRGHELEHAVVRLMRGLLAAMMGQSVKVERFKQTQNPLDACMQSIKRPPGSLSLQTISGVIFNWTPPRFTCSRSPK